jgi:hypothetical protein
VPHSPCQLSPSWQCVGMPLCASLTVPALSLLAVRWDATLCLTHRASSLPPGSALGCHSVPHSPCQLSPSWQCVGMPLCASLTVPALSLLAVRAPVVFAHGDLKPSNMMRTPDDAHPPHLLFIDLELAGPNYRGFDIMKLFRADAGAPPGGVGHVESPACGPPAGRGAAYNINPCPSPASFTAQGTNRCSRPTQYWSVVA